MGNGVTSLKDSFQRISPYSAPSLYSQHFGQNKDQVLIPARDGAILNFEKISTLNDPKSGFRGDVMLDRGSGHAVILYKGLDVPFKNEGNGRLAFLRDAFTAAQAIISGGRNNQTPFAEKLYLNTINDPRVKSVEVVGFSLGTLHANHIAAKYDVRATVLSDLGMGGDELKSMFKSAAEGRARMRENVTVLRMGLDLIPRIFGAGSSRGKVIDIDDGTSPDLSGLTHQARIYSEKALLLAPLPAV